MANVEARIAPFINELFYVTGEYGTIRPTHQHVGIDLATSSPKNLYSILDGSVIYKQYSSIRGNYIVVKGDNNYAFLYQHMQNPSPLNIGDRVTIGQFVGIEGTTGDVTGLHLHMEMQYLENRDWNFATQIEYYINPAEYMGFPNVTGTSVIYNGTPGPGPGPGPGPEPTTSKNSKKWLMSRARILNIKI